MSAAPSSVRNRGFDILRLLFAMAVVLSHAPELIDGNRTREVLGRYTDGTLSAGALAVDGFFLLSGFLITESWLRKPDLRAFMTKRILRIVPGFAVAYVLSAVVLGWLAPAIPHFFAHLLRNPTFYVNLTALRAPSGAPVLPGLHFPSMNGSLWTIGYEFRCYCLVAVLGLVGLLRNLRVLLILSVGMLALGFLPSLQPHYTNPVLQLIFGEAAPSFRLVAIYLVGSCYCLRQHRIPLAVWSACAGLAVLVGSWIWLRPTFEFAFVLIGSYLLFGASQMSWFRSLRLPLPDLSYGVYLYAWPIESLWIFFHRHTTPTATFLVGVFASLLAAAASWYIVEAPCLRLKPRGARPVIPA